MKLMVMMKAMATGRGRGVHRLLTIGCVESIVSRRWGLPPLQSSQPMELMKLMADAVLMGGCSI
jgi:hypothetical protein